MTYFSLDQLPRSSNRQRSLQNGKSASVSESVGFLQIGHCRFMLSGYRKEDCAAAPQLRFVGVDLWLAATGFGSNAGIEPEMSER